VSVGDQQWPLEDFTLQLNPPEGALQSAVAGFGILHDWQICLEGTHFGQGSSVLV